MARPPAIEAPLEAALAEARARWPGFRLSAARALARLEAAFPSGPPSGDWAPVHLRDLCLAWGCLEGDRGALLALHGLLEETRRRVARDGDAAQADEAVQALSEDLLVRPDREPLLGQYRGAGSLSKWLARAAANRALNLIRAERSRRKHERATAAGGSPDPELDLIRANHGAAFDACFAGALDGLPPERRRVLRLHYLEGLGMEEVADVLQVHRTTVYRWLEAARREVLEAVRARLLAERQVPADEVDSLLAGARSAMKLTLSRVLRTGTKPPNR